VPTVKPGDDNADDLLPEWDAPEELPPEPVATAEPLPEPVPLAEPVEEAAPAEAAPAPAAVPCPVCSSPRVGEAVMCHECGYHFTPADLAGAAAAAAPAAGTPGRRLRDRFELREALGGRGGVERFRGLDHAAAGAPAPVIILRQPLPPAAEPLPVPEPVDNGEGDDLLPGFDVPLALPTAAPATDTMPPRPAWPGVAWERALLEVADSPALPAVVASFAEDGYDYLVEEVPEGRPLWDAWDDPDAACEQRFGYLAQVAEALHHMHQHGAMLEAIRPELVVVTEGGRARLKDLGDLLPLPLTPDAPVRGTLYTAPELMAGHGQADARAGLYSFGGMLYALHVGRELSEIDFDRPGNPKPFIPRFPDIHPGFGRLLTKTFRREVDSRFPTDEAVKEDRTGFVELARTLRVLARTYDTVRLEIASWTTVGIVRTGNEDAFALLHATESRQDDLGEAALILLCDGMGGYEAGEVAAALAIQVMRQFLLAQPAFAFLAGKSAFPTDPLASVSRAEGHAGPPTDPEQIKQLLKAALLEANKQVFAASRAPGTKRRGMGCTAECVYVDGRNVVVGHVGDSRTYHLHEGRLVQLTRDQTFVNRMVELGTLTPEEAENHPRKNELQQAIGGQPHVEPGLYAGKMKPGDWVLVCSDGVTNHVTPAQLKEMMQTEAGSAETAARRLVNLTLIEGATDNATVVVVRAT
jgi:PPM family protein phosphatase